MSEEFDKEAEREKLRQQLAEEEADRQATQHMSDLLLKGATMTNRHCDECGDPLFRHEGREFCPTCGRERSPAAEESASDASTPDTGQTAGDGGTTAATPDRPGATPADQPPSGDAGGQSTPASQPGEARPSRSNQGRSTTGGEGDLIAAREALARKVTALSHEAEAATNVDRARELLTAVREGARALRELERADR